MAGSDQASTNPDPLDALHKSEPELAIKVRILGDMWRAFGSIDPEQEIPDSLNQLGFWTAVVASHGCATITEKGAAFIEESFEHLAEAYDDDQLYWLLYARD